MTKKEIIEKGKQHAIHEVLSFFFKANKNWKYQKTETIQKWIDVIFEKFKDKKEVEKWTQKQKYWVSKIIGGHWVTNKFHKKLFYKLM